MHLVTTINVEARTLSVRPAAVAQSICNGCDSGVLLTSGLNDLRSDVGNLDSRTVLKAVQKSSSSTRGNNKRLNSYHFSEGFNLVMFSLYRSRIPSTSLPTFRSIQWRQRPQSHRLLHTGEPSGPATSNYTAKKSSWSSPTILLLGFIPIFTFTLGTWQLQRLQWKINLIDELEEKLQRDPILLPKRIKCEHIFFRIE